MIKVESLETPPAKLGGPSRRNILKALATLGLTGPTAMAALRIGNARAGHGFLGDGELFQGVEKLIKAAQTRKLARYIAVDITGTDMPWKDIDIDVEEGQEVTILLSGRWWLVRELDVWVEPGTSFFARVAGKNPIYNPMRNTGTFVGPHSGKISVARSLGEWSDKNAETVATPQELYQKTEGGAQGIILIWNGDAGAGLRDLRAHGDVAGILSEEIARLATEAPTPEGWQPLYLTGNPGIFSSCEAGQICCDSHKNACLIKSDVSLPLEPDATIDWRWSVEELPSTKAENELLSHDYLSIAVEFEDGQDITYMWSSELPVGHVFRCPIPAWNAIETHMVVRTGRDQLGQWLSEKRNIYDDYREHIGGHATQIVGVWLIALSFFQRGTAKARFADIVVRSGDQDVRLT